MLWTIGPLAVAATAAFAVHALTLRRRGRAHSGSVHGAEEQAAHRARMRHERTFRLYEHAFSPEHLVQVVQEAWRAGCKWSALTGRDRFFYRAAIIRAVGSMDTRDGRSRGRHSREDFPGVVGLDPAETEGHATRILLVFFGNLCVYTEAGLIDSELVRRLFQPLYAPFAGFFRELRDEVVAVQPADQPPPPWVTETRLLESNLFGLGAEPPAVMTDFAPAECLPVPPEFLALEDVRRTASW